MVRRIVYLYLPGVRAGNDGARYGCIPFLLHLLPHIDPNSGVVYFIKTGRYNRCEWWLVRGAEWMLGMNECGC